MFFVPLQICKKLWPNTLFQYKNIQNTWTVTNIAFLTLAMVAQFVMGYCV